jgi:hypothetical protein
MLMPIGTYNVIKETVNTGLGVGVKLHYGREKTFHFRAAMNSGAGTAVFQAYGSNVVSPSASNVGDWVPIGSPITLSLNGTTTVSDGFEDFGPWLWINVSMVSITAGGQGEAWVAA